MRRRVTTPTDEAVNWRPIHLAQSRQCACRLRQVRERATCDHAPVCGSKTRPAFLQRASSWFHRPSVSNGGRPFTTFLRKLDGKVTKKLAQSAVVLADRDSRVAHGWAGLAPAKQSFPRTKLLLLRSAREASRWHDAHATRNRRAALPIANILRKQPAHRADARGLRRRNEVSQ